MKFEGREYQFKLNSGQVRKVQALMESTKQYLQQKVQPFLQLLFQQYLPEDDFKSIDDLFNVQKFHNFLMCILSQQTKQKISDLELVKDNDGNMSYDQMRIRNFQKILQIIENTYEVLGLGQRRKITKSQIQSMVQKHNMRVLSYFLDYVYQLLKHNNTMVEFITTLNSQIQDCILQVMKNANYNSSGTQQYKSEKSIMSLQVADKLNQEDQVLSNIEQFQQMQIHLQAKEQEIRQIKLQKQLLQEEIEQLHRAITHKDQQVEMFKKRILSYEEIDQLMQQKDDQIFKLTKRLAEIQLKFRLKQSQLINQNKNINQKIAGIQLKDSQLMSKYQKQKLVVDILNKQKQQAEVSMKKVINNLKEKNRLFSDKINDLQKQLIQVNFEKQMKDKQLIQLKSCQRIGNKNHNFGTLNSPRSPLRGQDFLQGIESVHGNYSKLGEQLSVDLDRTQFEDEFDLISRPTQNSNKRFTQLLQQNYSLKQKINLQQSSNFADQKQFRQLKDQIQKTKKKNIILKRRNQDIENQRKEEIDIIISVMEQCYHNSFQVPHKK